MLNFVRNIFSLYLFAHARLYAFIFINMKYKMEYKSSVNGGKKWYAVNFVVEAQVYFICKNVGYEKYCQVIMCS